MKYLLGLFLIFTSVLPTQTCFCADIQEKYLPVFEVHQKIQNKYVEKANEMIRINKDDDIYKMVYVSGELNAYLDCMEMIYPHNPMYTNK